MANVKPFQPFRYSAKAGDPANLLTQPYDKINAQMQCVVSCRESAYNLVRICSRQEHTRVPAKCFEDWIREGVLVQDQAPGFYVYTQEFEVPDSGVRLTRTGFIGLGKLEDYSANIVYRHEQTLTGPKKDRRELLDHARAHLEQLFMLYPDPQGAIARDPRGRVEGATDFRCRR